MRVYVRVFVWIHTCTYTHTYTHAAKHHTCTLSYREAASQAACPPPILQDTPAHGCSAGVSWKFVHAYMSVCRHVRNHGFPDSVQAMTNRYKLGPCQSKPADQRPSGHCREVNVCKWLGAQRRNLPQSVLTTRGTSYSLQCEHKRGPPSCLSQTSKLSPSHHNFEF